MSGTLNKVLLIGHLGADPEIRRTQDGKPVVTLSIATGETWRDKASGERREITDWHRVVIFNENLCKVAEQYLKKGSKVFVEGQQKTRKWRSGRHRSLHHRGGARRLSRRVGAARSLRPAGAGAGRLRHVVDPLAWPGADRRRRRAAARRHGR